MGPNAVAGTAVLDPSTHHFGYVGRVVDASGAARFVILAGAASTTTVACATGSGSCLRIVIDGVAYPADLKSFDGSVVESTFEGAVSAIVEVFAKEPAARFSATGGAFPVVSDIDGLPAIFDVHWDSGGERSFDGTLALALDPSNEAGILVQLSGELGAGGFVTVSAEISSFTDTQTQSTTVVVSSIIVSGMGSDVAFPASLQLRSTSIDDALNKFLRFALAHAEILD